MIRPLFQSSNRLKGEPHEAVAPRLLLAQIPARRCRGTFLAEPPLPVPAPRANSAHPVPIARIWLPKGIHRNEDYRNHRLDDVNAKGVEFERCDFSYCIITRGYFREAKFTDCTFIGARFIDCNFRRAVFYSCDLSYATFTKSLIDVHEILPSLPQHPNVRRESLHALRANAIETGDYDSLRALVMQEVQVAVEHYSRALRGSDDYYRQKYATFSQKVICAARLLQLRVSGFVWGHGERPLQIFTSCTLFLLALAFINVWSVMPRTGWQASAGGLLIVRYVFELFLFLDVDKNFRGFLLVDYVIAIMRYVYVGLFVSVMYKRISRR